jgi:hypothetical protein
VKERILALYPDCKRTLHLFSGTIPPNPRHRTITYDIAPKVLGRIRPTICDDVRNILKHRRQIRPVDLTVADPPYDPGDFERYGQEPFGKPEVIRNLGVIMRPGTHLAWLDIRIPVFNAKTWKLLGQIGFAVNLNTRVRMLTMLQHV